jgi:hypothetical protein
MKKTIRLTESELISLVKRVIKEETEIMGPFDGLDMNELIKMGIDVEGIERKGEEIASNETEKVENIVDNAVLKIPEVKKLNSEQLGEFNRLKEEIKGKIKSVDVCTKEGKRELFKFLKDKRDMFFRNLRKSFFSKNNGLQEQVSPGVSMLLFVAGLLLVLLILIIYNYRSSTQYCRNMRSYRRSQMGGPGRGLFGLF